MPVAADEPVGVVADDGPPLAEQPVRAATTTARMTRRTRATARVRNDAPWVARITTS
jgi:hypothetical protein